MTLNFYVDFRSPAAYLALEPTLALVDELAVPIVWQPYRMLGRPTPTRVADSSVTNSHLNTRARARRAMAEHYARLRGLEMHWRDDPGSADLALATLARLTDGDADPRSFAQAAFRAYWRDGADLNDPETVSDLLEPSQQGLIASDDDILSLLHGAETAAVAQGVVDAPAYLVADQVFVGREHLPWIRELLEARS